MTNRQRLQTLVLALAGAGLVALAPARAQTDPGNFVSQPDGTVTTYQRTSEGSYGNFSGAVRWTQTRRDWNGRTWVAQDGGPAGITLHDPARHTLVASLKPAGQPVYSYDPPVGYDWPLAVGKAWTVVYGLTTYARPATISMTMNFKVEALEDVTVPAGTFKAYKVVSTDNLGEVQQVWTTPSLGLATVKRINDRPASHPLGAGHLEGVLVSRVLPAS